jgi:regulatory protein
VVPSSETDADPDRHVAAARPARVARFDDLDAVAEGSDDGPQTPRVARFDGLHERPVAAIRVAGLDGLDQQAGTGNRVAAFDGDLDRSGAARSGAARSGAARSRRSPKPRPPDARAADTASDTRRPADAAGDGVVPRGARRPVDQEPGDPVPTDADVPPDAPLPRGRRRGGRGRRGDTAAPAPEQPDTAADPVAVAREICLRMLTDRARTRQELAQALARKGVPEDAAAAVLDRFDEVGLIDDAAFAGQWVRSRHAHRGLGRRAIAVELRRKGVADDVAGEALAEVDGESEERRAHELVDRKLRSLTVDTPEQRASAGRRLVGMLARKGYGAGTAYRVVREALAEHGAEADELGGIDG